MAKILYSLSSDHKEKPFYITLGVVISRGGTESSHFFTGHCHLNHSNVSRYSVCLCVFGLGFLVWFGFFPQSFRPWTIYAVNIIRLPGGGGHFNFSHTSDLYCLHSVPILFFFFRNLDIRCNYA